MSGRSKEKIIKETIRELKSTMQNNSFEEGKDLLTELTRVGKQLYERERNEFVALNIVLQVLKMVQEEAQRIKSGTPDLEEDITNMLFAMPDDTLASVNGEDLKKSVLDSLGEFELEMETAEENITIQGVEHIHFDELILTMSPTRTVERFLRNASKSRRFHLIMVKTEDHSGESLAKLLPQHNQCKVTVIAPSAIFAIMSRVNKVILGPEAIFADGSFRGAVGMYAAALAAKHYRVPVLLCAPLYKISPLWHCPPLEADLGCPSRLLPGWQNRECELVHQPHFDLVPADTVSFVITNNGCFPPSFVYRIVKEHYSHKHVQELTADLWPSITVN